MSNTRHRGKTQGDAQHAAHTDADPAAEAGMSRDIINLPDNVIQDGIKDYPEPDQDDILWAFAYAREHSWTRTEFCSFIDTTWSTIWKVATGYRDPTTGKLAKTDAFMGKLRDARARAARTVNTGFVETPVTKKIHDLLDYAMAGDMEGGKIVLIAGPTGRSKTHAVREWCKRNNHGRSVYIDCPESGGLRSLMYEMCGATGVGKGKKTAELRNALIGAFSRRRILVLDEVKRIMPTKESGHPREMEFIRRLHDVQRCPIALIATNWFYEELRTGRFSGYLEQLDGRIAEPLFIPEKVLRSEARAIVQAFSQDDPSSELISLAQRIGNGPGRLRVLFELLKQAAAAAKRSRAPLDTKHLAAALMRRQGRFQWEAE